MTSTHASSPHLKLVPPHLRELYFPPSTKPEKFVLGRTVKGRNEPCAIGGVAWVVFSLHKGEKTEAGEELKFEDVVSMAWRNTVDLFGLTEFAD
jgi:TatD DNase family protein